jgi:hypothetical protein
MKEKDISICCNFSYLAPDRQFSYLFNLYPANMENMVSYWYCQQMADGIQFSVWRVNSITTDVSASNMCENPTRGQHLNWEEQESLYNAQEKCKPV